MDEVVTGSPADAEESWEEIEKVLSLADMVFVVACIGNSTRTGAAPVVACLSKEAGKLTVGLQSNPLVLNQKPV